MLYYRSASLLPFELLTILPCCALSVAIPVPACPACLPGIPFIPAHMCFIPPLNSPFVLLTTSSRLPFFSTISFAFSSYSINLPSCRSFARCTSPYSFGLFYFLVPPFHCSVKHHQRLPYDFTCCSFTNCSHPFMIIAPGLFLSTSLFVVPVLSKSSENCSAVLAISSWKYCCFSFIVSLSILHLYDFLPRLF